MTERWLILADDLTGAADGAIAFGRRGHGALVSWGAIEDGGPMPEVIAYDANSRGLDAGAAARTHRRALERLLDPDRILFKKIDSTLRGQPAAETAATIAFLQARHGLAFGILAPAFPSTGRTTIDGRVRVGGRPLEDAEVWRRDHTYRSADLVAIMAEAEIKAEPVPLEIVRGTALSAAFEAIAARGGAVAACDAETDDDLRRIAAASRPARQDRFFIGSAGLAHALAAGAPGGTAAAPPIPARGQGALIVVGSLADASRQGARKLVAGGRIVHVPVEPAALLDPAGAGSAVGHEVARLLDAGSDVLVEIRMDEERLDMSLGPRLAEALAAALEPAAHRMSAFAATGGETAAALLSRFGVNGIELIDEIEPGVAFGLTRGRLTVPVATKAGAFGDEDSLGRIADKLRAIRKNGIST